MWVDIASFVEHQKTKRTKTEITDGNLYSKSNFEWQAIQPNPLTSDPITKSLFFGRAILVPGNRVFVISGSLSNKVTDKVSDET